MEKKSITWITRGMNQDSSVSAFSPEFSFENYNMRLSTNEDNTTMSWVNERGTEKLDISLGGTPNGVAPFIPTQIEGTPVGTAIINHQLVLFTHKSDSRDNIYVLTFNGTRIEGRLLYAGNLNLSVDHPLETHTSYESDLIQKVYWTDGVNQPRVINIAASIEKQIVWNSNWQLQNPPVDTWFDFVPSFKAATVTVEKSNTGGTMPACSIQYCLTYINKYGQQSNVFYTSPQFFTSLDDRAASPEEMTANSFKITISDADTGFDLIRIYSIQRTSVNSTPIVKIVDELPIVYNAEIVTQFSISKVWANSENGDYAFSADEEEDFRYLKNITVDHGSVSVTASNIIAEFEYDDFISFWKVNRWDINNSTHVARPSDTDLELKFKLGKHGNDKSLVDTILTDRTGDYRLRKYYTVYTLGYDLIEDHLLSPADVDAANSNTNGLNYLCLRKGNETYTTLPYLWHYGDNNYDGTVDGTVINGFILVCDFINRKWYILRNESDITYTENADQSTSVQGIVYTDTGTTGTSVDPFELLYAGGRAISCNTMCEKDNTLFLGNLTYKTDKVTDIQNYVKNLVSADQEPLNVTFDYKRPIALKEETYNYTSFNSMSDRESTTFKGGDTYRFGFQLQKSTGEWSDPIFIKDVQNDLYPVTSATQVRLVKALCTIAKGDTIDWSQYVAARPVIVYPTIADRNVICQGVLNPTVFNLKSRKDKLYYSQPYWSFALYHYNENPASNAQPFVPKNCHYAFVENEIQCINSSHIENADLNPWNLSNASTTKTNAQYLYDNSIITLNSPDIEFDTEVQSLSTQGLKLRIIGAIEINSLYKAHHITASEKVPANYNLETKKLRSGDDFRYAPDCTKGVEQFSSFKDNPETMPINWSDVRVLQSGENYVTDNGNNNLNQSAADPSIFEYDVYTWHRTGSLCNDMRSADVAVSVLKTKVISNWFLSNETRYFKSIDSLVNLDVFNDINSQFVITDSASMMNVRLPKQCEASSDIDYRPNIDEVLYDNLGYTQANYKYVVDNTNHPLTAYNPVSIKYKSTSHAVIALKASSDSSVVPIMPIPIYDGYRGSASSKWNEHSGTKTQWGDNLTFDNNHTFDVTSLTDSLDTPMLWLAELYKDPNSIDSTTRFGGNSAKAIQNNKWLVAGDTVAIGENNIQLEWTVGDTYYQMYDCLKTYPFTREDTNQVVSICSFMCESHVNMDGRYDKNRGQLDNTNMSPVNFNLLNPIYNQRANFFTAQATDSQSDGDNKYPNLVTWSKTKESGADVDLFTNITLGSTLELDGNKGEITSLQKMNDSIIAFQDSGFSQILYNENVQLSTTQGVPVEIANSGKVSGKRYISNNVGCSNKWSICNTPAGIYFMDDKTKDFYLFNGQLTSLSHAHSMNPWFQKHCNCSTGSWDPVTFAKPKALYDTVNQDVLLGFSDVAIAWAERMQTFTSMYSYGGVPYLETLDGVGLWIDKNGSIWRHQSGDYCNFFGINKPFSITYLSSADSLNDKIFTNLDFRAFTSNNGMPFNYVEVWNDYQHGKSNLTGVTASNMGLHHEPQNGESTLKRKFRIWRCDIPRDNAPIEDDSALGLHRTKPFPMNRIRNPWAYIKMQYNPAVLESIPKVNVNDVTMIYYT